MGLQNPFLRRKAAGKSSDTSSPPPTTLTADTTAAEKGNYHEDNTPIKSLTAWTFFMAVLVSMGGMVFGYDTGQISGFLEMRNFEENFGNKTNPLGFSVVRSGLIVGMLSIGTLIGALIAAPIANTRALGRKYSVCLWVVIFDVGVVVQMASNGGNWEQVMAGRIVAGLGIGALSVIVPMYQGETSPDHNRGAVVCCYQLFITIGILVANLINFGTETIQSEASWRIVMGVGFIWSTVLGAGILAFPETPRWDFRMGRVDEARKTIAKFLGVDEGHHVVRRQLEEMREKLDFEQVATHPWYEVFTGPKMPYRVPLGMIILGLQQLSGANYFFYYGTTVFSSVGLSNPFVTQIILGAVNVVTTFPGLWFVERFGRRKPLIIGAAWMSMCFIVFASIGQFKLTNADGTQNQGVGYAMIVFACLFITAFASTWGPMAWTVASEIYPGRYRSQAIALCSGSNWLFNFLLAFFTPFISNDINFAYGYVFAGCNLFAVFFVFFFLPETAGRSLEEIDTLFLLEVKPWKSKSWVPPEGEELITADMLMLNKGATGISKRQEADGTGEEQMEQRPGEAGLPHVPILEGGSGRSMGAGVRGESFAGEVR